MLQTAFSDPLCWLYHAGNDPQGVQVMVSAGNRHTETPTFILKIYGL